MRQIGRNLGLQDEFVQRHPFPGPGLAIRVICGDEPYMERDFSETQVLLKILSDYSNSVHKVRQAKILNFFLYSCLYEYISIFNGKN